MKNQYFGDVNDYLKYSLLRLLGGDGQLAIAVCWALTEDDGGLDGRRTRYLEQPEAWSKYDASVFWLLREEVVHRGNRCVSAIESADVLKNCRFFSNTMNDEANLRRSYFEAFYRFAKGADFVFFDPDNGLDVKSIRRGAKGSSKYVYIDEIERAYGSGHSVLFYQHFPRKPHDTYVSGLVKRLRSIKGVRRAVSYSSSCVVFLLLPQPHHENLLLSNTRAVAKDWGDRVSIKTHPIDS